MKESRSTESNIMDEVDRAIIHLLKKMPKQKCKI